VYNATEQLIAEYSTASLSGGGTSYLATDHLASTRAVIDGNGNLKVRRDYLPFGEEIADYTRGGRSAVAGYGGSDDTRQHFTGKERDPESALDYFFARYYSASQGRFTSADPGSGPEHRAVNPQRWNLYVYVRNNPLALIDPDGQEDKGGGGGKVIDIFIALNRHDFRTGNKYTNFTALKGFAAKHGYTVNVHDYSESTFENVKKSLNTATATFIDAHGLSEPGDRAKKAWGIRLNGSTMSFEGKGVSGQDNAVEGRPTSNVKVLGLFGCNTKYMESPISPNENTIIISVDSGPDGGTSVPALTASLKAFVREYIATDGDVIAAADAGTKALQKSDPDPHNKGDKLSVELYDRHLVPEEQKPPGELLRPAIVPAEKPPLWRWL